MKPLSILQAVACLILITSHAPSTTLAGPGHDHGPTPGEGGLATGPVALSEQAIQNLGIETFSANIVELAPSLEMPAVLTLPPNGQAAVSAKFSGKVHALLAQLGERVEKGQPLARLDPDTIGNPLVLLRAPIAGVVSQQNVTIGDAFGPATVLLEISDPTRLQARAIAYEGPDLAKIRPGQSAQVLVEMFPEEVFEGRVVRISPGLQTKERTYEAFVEIENPNSKLLPNSQATVAMPLGEPVTVLAVPKRAVVGDLARRSVFVRDDNVFERRDVVTGISSGNLVEIVEGVFPGEEVVTQGNYQLQFASSEGGAAGGHGHDDHGHDHGHSHSGHGHDAASTILPVPWLIGGIVIAFIILLTVLMLRQPRA